MSAENFLSRWSRRKRRAELPPEPADATPPDPAAPEGSAEAPHTEDPRDPTPGPDEEMSAEEIARLPSLEELTAETDLSVFLRRGVPEPLRKAALRRMWSLDPKIRDYVSEAREYAYDWNTPGGVPGFGGALPSGEEVARMAARIVGGERSDPAHPHKEENKGAADAGPPEPEQGLSPAPGSEARETRAAPTSALHGEPAGGAQDPASEPLPASEPADRAVPAAEPPSPADEPASVASPRRHGAAIPL